jgi:hypothetical protein
MRNVDFLQLLLVQSLFCASASITGMSTDSSPPRPWWEAPHLTYTPVDANYSWEKRKTGVTDHWKAGLSVWSHYNRTALEKVAHRMNTTSATNNCAPIPWTSGRMLKCLRRVNETAFELHSVYEPSAVGDWFNQGQDMKTRPHDGLMEHGHVFHKTPYRVTRVTHLPMQLPEHWPVAASTSRVTIVQPDAAATVSCPRWLPDDEHQSDELLQGNYVRLEFAELWLDETLMRDNTSNDDSHREPEGAVKVGLFCQYNGVTGELMQVFCMREVALPEDLNPDQHPATEPLDLAQLQATLEKRHWPAWTDRGHLDPSSSAAARQLASGAPVASVLKQAGWTRVSGRVVQTESPDGPEVACTVQNTVADADATDADLLDYEYADPICPEDQELYWDVRCSDGVYFRIPKTFHPTHLSEGVCLELGCLTRTGLHRVVVVGSRSQGGLHTTVYERWSSAAAGEKERSEKKESHMKRFNP